MGFEVLQAGFFTTVQDLGRYQYQKFGMIVSGVMDSFASRIANSLVGNKEDEAVLEAMLNGLKIKMTNDAVIAITGKHAQPLLNGESIAMWRPIFVRKGDIISLSKRNDGLFTYIAFSGGFDIPSRFKSKSTFLSANFGGFKGRALAKNDYIPLKDESNTNLAVKRYLQKFNNQPNWFVRFYDNYAFTNDVELKVIEGKEFDWFTEESKDAFFNNQYRLTSQSNRMGFRLEGPALEAKDSKELLSEGVTFGTIQVPSSGQPIILMADHQTTGGYPKIGQLISAHFARLAQLQPGTKIKFTLIPLEEAEDTYIQREYFIKQIQKSISLKISGLIP